ncbi:MAG: hypothetical protein COA69_02945 [Robiginitomaculum sp.]|nr:MAG: hypothetical protein COA69_02945 [Robiginitomaculum sp.]
MFSDKQWSFNARLGVMFVGSVEAELSSTGLLASDPNFLIELNREVNSLESDLDGYKYYPVVSLGFSRNF